jgi:uncharacterized protein (DUF4415 family)
MPANERSTARDSVDDAPDLSAPEWQAKFATAPVRRGRPPAQERKISTTIRLDRDVVEAFKATGPGWQTRINDTLRRAARRQKSKASR